MPRTSKYSQDFIDTVLKRLEPPSSETVNDLSEELGIPSSTIYTWVKRSNGSLRKQKPKDKWTSKDKFHVVLETATLSELQLAEYCRRKGLYVEEVKAWKEQCLNANNEPVEDTKKIKSELKEEKIKAKELEKELRMKEKALAETAALLVLRKKANANLGGPRGRLISDSDRVEAVKLIKEAVDSGARLRPACAELNISDRTYQRWSKGNEVKKDQRPLAQRPVPKNKLSDEERSIILDTVNSPEYADLPPSQIVPKLANEGKYLASESTIYRILREEKMNAHRSKTKEPIKKEAPTHIATAPNKVWTWDITWLNASVKGAYFKLYLILDMFSRMIVAYEVWESEKAEYAEQLVRKATLSQGIAGRPLVLHSDNGSPMKAATFQATLEKLGIQSSFSRPRVSNDNPYSESLFKTMKYVPKYPTIGFQSIDEARKWVRKFVSWYNNEHLHSGIKFITPYQRHYGLDKAIMAKRIEAYKLAQRKHPERWARHIRNWELPEFVALNPIKDEEAVELISQEEQV
ncbi:IS3 family transposase [Alkalicella caledoniensis]|uniref:IS3 family transposase n=1 Tax=Alkalicella caledoniensis TaxID=2731377 RepID=A0A7G9WBP1_ALKCA|nr:IS3 family transposase [Alkalicella caledoniensis]QNO15361.1 IS3 family transposase [Alkalicella caledoniensis]QNO16103.1 IS3 family transposase [Alkalicella caledoniensis]